MGRQEGYAKPDWSDVTKPWTFHPFSEKGDWGGHASGYGDLNGDGRIDILQGSGWWEQKRDAQGNISFVRHMIMGDPAAGPAERRSWEETDKSVAFTELHALALADLDGDGLPDIVTGKRWWSHGDNYGSKDAQAAPVLYWFRLVRRGGKVAFEPHLLNNRSGLGVQIVAADGNGDGKPDVLAAARKGVFVFFNQFGKR